MEKEALESVMKKSLDQATFTRIRELKEAIVKSEHENNKQHQHQKHQGLDEELCKSGHKIRNPFHDRD